MKKVAILSTHPVQYQIPWFQGLAACPDMALKVYYSMLPDRQQQGVGFGVPFQWDIPMFDGYTWEALENMSRSPTLGSFFGASTPGIRAALKEERPDVVIVTGWHSWSLLQGLWACIRLGIPVIVRAESNALRQRPWWIKAMHKLLLSQFDAFLAIGKANRDLYLANGIDAPKIFACRYFVDNDRIRLQCESYAKSRLELRAAWSIPPDCICFLFVGKLQAKKRILDLLRALDLARRTRKTIHLLVAGAGEQMEEATGIVESQGLPVSFAGFLNQSELPKVYSVADCLVLPSDYGETWGLVVNEAMACGLPAIVSDRVGCGPDLVLDGVTGAIFPFGNVSELARRMVELAADPASRKAMGERARSHIENYTVARAVEGTIEAIETVWKDRSQAMSH